MNGKFLRVLLGLVLSSTILMAQNKTVSGTVADADAVPIPGVSILNKGKSTGTVTDANGRYSLEVANGDVLVFSFIGFVAQEVTVGNQSVIDVTMETDVTELQEIVVTGYATQQKKDLTGSVGVVATEELTQIPSGNVANQLQGRAAGVTVVSDGRPGSPSKVRIRGFGSFQNNDPLYIVDGVPTQDITTLNPNDIQSLSVLKDAGAASIYGSRAANGVIIITTKQGKSGVAINYNMFVGTQNPGNGPTADLLNAREYMQLQQLVYDNDGTSETHPVYGQTGNLTLPSWAGDTDWYDEITDAAGIMNHDISLSSGNDKSKFYAGLNYFKQDGIVKYTNSQRISGRFNSEFKIGGSDRFKIGENLTVSHTQRGQGVSNQNEGSSINQGVYRTQPIIPVIWNSGSFAGIGHTFENGEWGGTGIAPRLGNGDNELAQLTRDKDDWRFDVRVLGSTFFDAEIIEGLNFRTTFGGTYRMGYYNDYNFATYESAENVATPSFTEGADWGSDWVWTNTLTYNTTFGDAHTLLAVAGYEAVKYGIGRSVSGNRAGYFTDNVDFRTLNNGATIQNANSNANTPTTLVSTFLRVDYGYMDKYLLSATVRRDGSSRFGADTRFGTFPSFSAGWRISDESFLSGSSVLSELKIRGGYGIMGNQLAVNPQNQFFLFGGSAASSNYDISGTTSSSVQGFRPTRIGNPDAKWEENVTTNVGFDAAFFDNKVEWIFDWYSKETQDLLYNPELPGTAGAASQPFVNIAAMKNTGIDMQFIYRNQWGDFGFEGNLTFTTFTNEIVAIAEGVEFFDAGSSRIGSFNRNAVGQSVGSFYGYTVQGLFQSSAEVSGAATQDGAEEGFFRYQDIDNSGAIDPDDRDFIGNPNPDFTYGLNLSFTYGNFDLTTFIYGSQGNEIFNYNRWWVDFWPSFQGQKSQDLLNNSWTPSNTGASTPKASNKSNFSTNTVSSSYYLEDGSFTRMKNLQLGYNFPKSTLGNSGIKSLRIYLQGTNLFTLTDYSGLDPEIGSEDGGGSDTAFGVDEGNYPSVKQFTVGLNLGF
jgi:TonB-linked SusC/RagA family outer membrane protein